jgi:phosphatidylglycerol:prolipoprotein diacylglycerol transferase
MRLVVAGQALGAAIAVIAFDFDPILRLGNGGVRLETVGIALVILVGLAAAGLIARSMRLRSDDLLFVVLGIVPGAVVGGRIGYVLLHPGFFGADPARILDPGLGSLELTLGVVGGAVTGVLVATLLDGRPGRWLHAATLPTLLVLGAGKLAMVLGGRGQGQPWDGGLATAFVGPGPWGSLAPDIPSHPSQVYEAIGAFIVLLVVLAILAADRRVARGALIRPDGRAFAIGLALWSLARLVVASTWRDTTVAGPFRSEQLIDAGVFLGCLVVMAWLARRRDAPEEAETLDFARSESG